MAIITSGAPTSKTAANIGDHLVDSTTGKVYECISVNTYGGHDAVTFKRKKTEYVWKCIGDDPNYGSALPSGGTPYQYLVTDGDGTAKWEDRLAYSETIEWDGNAEGKEIFGGDLVLLKKIPGITLEKVLEGTIEGFPISNVPSAPLAEGIYFFDSFYLVTQDNVFCNGVTIPYAGIYTLVEKQPFTMCIPIETIKNEYLPKNYRVVFWIKYDSTGSNSSIHCNCSYEELKSLCVGQSVPILGSLFDKNEVKQLVYVNYIEDSATIHLQFYSGMGNNILKLNYKQDGSITRPVQ